MKKIKALKIDVNLQGIYEVEIEANLAGLYNAIDCELVEILRIETGHKNLCWIDEEGRLRDDIAGYFIFDAGTRKETIPMAGHGIITGNEDSAGNLTDYSGNLSDYSARITFAYDIPAAEKERYLTPVMLTGRDLEAYFNTLKNTL